MDDVQHVEHVIQTALTEHDHGRDLDGAPGFDAAQYMEKIKDQLGQPSKIPRYTRASPALSLVSFSCLLQDTGYPMEVYLPGGVGAGTEERDIDWSKLKERWVGWGVEIPGEQDWVMGDEDLAQIENLTLEPTSLPSVVRNKYPLPDKDGNYLGALIKVYTEAAYKPATTYRFIGILSRSSMPTAEHDDPEVVPAIHVLQVNSTEQESDPSPSDEDVRESLVDYLATAFEPHDRLAAEYLLLLLISHPAVRQPSVSPLGTLSICFKRKSAETTAKFVSVVQAIAPRVVPLTLSVPLLHAHSFSPSSTDSSSLDAGLLQLAEGTALVVDEDGMGAGGQLNQQALENLKALIDCVNEQRVRYQYPYMDGLKMECAVRVAVLSQAKSLLPVDMHVPVQGTGQVQATSPDVASLRSYIARYGSPTHAARLIIPEETGQVIQDSFVEERKRGNKDAEEALKRRMKVARLMALSYPAAKLTREIWQRTVQLDEQVTKRHASY